MAKLLTDQQLDLLTNGIMSKIREKENSMALQNAKHPKLNMAPLRKAAEAYLKERAKVIQTVYPIASFITNNYCQPDNIDLSDFDKYQAEVDKAWSKKKSGARSNEQMNRLRDTIKADILRNSISAADLEQVLTAIEKKYC